MKTRYDAIAGWRLYGAPSVTWNVGIFHVPGNDNAKMVDLWHCICGCDKFELRRDGPYCCDCGQFAYSWINGE